jgi:uncharacterized Zn finger protein
LALTPEGHVIAWVRGTQRYTTLVGVAEGRLYSLCNCPYDAEVCKHAVAVTLQYAAQIGAGSKIPSVSGNDPRLAAVQNAVSKDELESSFSAEEEDDHLILPPLSDGPASSSLSHYLRQQNKKQLLSLLQEAARRHPDIKADLQAHASLDSKDSKGLVRQIQKDIRALSAKPVWYNPWTREGHIPDYSQVHRRLEMLLKNGYADDVMSLGRQILETGIPLVEGSDDEGDTARQIASCLELVFQALPDSSMPQVDQMLWAVEADLKDDYELCYGSEAFWSRRFPRSSWSALADKLARRLENERRKKRSTNGDDLDSSHYDRERLSHWLVKALRLAGRREEAIAVAKQEALENGDYPHLVQLLMDAGRPHDAEEWARRGIEATRSKWPGIASELRGQIIGLREDANDWPAVAAMHAIEFFRFPSLRYYLPLKEAATRAGVWEEVKSQILLFLETGRRPRKELWPLPDSGLSHEEGSFHTHISFPEYSVLIEIAIHERRTHDVFRWHQKLVSARKQNRAGRHSGLDENVADALKNDYPDTAIDIWKNLAEEMIAVTQTNAYKHAAGYLRKVRRALLSLDRTSDWQSYLENIKQINIRKRRLLEILDGLDRPLVEPRRS